MLDFQKLTLQQLSQHRSRFELNPDRICDRTAGTIFMWRHLFDTQYAEVADTFIFKIRYLDEKNSFLFPFGANVDQALDAMDQYCREEQVPFRFHFVSQQECAHLIERFPDLQVREERNWFDYLYQAQDLIQLNGKKYHGQRNFVNRFRKNHPQYQFLPIGEENKAMVRTFFKQQQIKNFKEGPLAEEEFQIVSEILENWELYSFCGGILVAEDQVVGISIGEISGDTLYVHVEKADITFAGAYPMLSHEFLVAFVNETILYVNREEDLGQEGLRTAKLSYHPIALPPKYTLEYLINERGNK